jgi:hypothetical protein
LTRIHPADWDHEGWDIIQRANLRNVPPLPQNELMATFSSVERLERRNNPLGHTSGAYRGSNTPSSGPIILTDGSDAVKHIADVADAQKIDQTDVYPLQMKCFDEVILGGVCAGDVVVIAGQTGHGKCLGEGTPIIMFDGTIKKVEEIRNGDCLMGPDSKPRMVSGITSGIDDLYKIIPVKGESYIVNSDHVLSLKRTQTQLFKRGKPMNLRKGEIINISIQEYIKQSGYFKHIHKGWRSGVEWRNKKVNIDPYFLGVWLGDGTSSKTDITSMDKEVVTYCSNYAEKMGLKTKKYVQKNNQSSVYSFTTGYSGGRKNPLRELLRKNNVFKNKHIPFCYLINSRENRLQLLAGLIDTDGYKNTNVYEFVNKNERLARNVMFLAQSLGYYSSCHSFVNKRFNLIYWKVGISGDCSLIPVKIPRKKVEKRTQKKDVLMTGISVLPVGVGRFYGFELDRDGLFLLGDFTVTHNTSLAQDWTMSLVRGDKKVKALWFSYEVLVSHLWNKFQEMGMTREDCIFIPAKHTDGNVAWIEAKIKEGKEKFGIKAVFIDHLGFLLPKTNGILGKNLSSNYASFLTQVMRDLKTIALKEEIIIFLPVHMKKPDYHNKHADIDDIKDSSGVGQESDLVFLIEREKDKTENTKSYFTDSTKITLAKNRKTGITVVGKFTMINGRFAYDSKDAKLDKELEAFGKEKEEVVVTQPLLVATEKHVVTEEEMEKAILNNWGTQY